MLQVPTVRVEELNAWNAPLVSGDAPGVVVLGVETRLEAGRRWHLQAGGVGGPRTLMAGEAWARARGLGVGSTVRLVSGRRTVSYTLSGLLTREGLGELNHGQVVVGAIGEVRRDFDLRPDETHELALLLDPRAPPETVMRKLQEVLPPGASVVRPKDRGRDVGQRLAILQAGTDLTSSLALFLSAFLIYSLYATAAAERARDIGLLRCVGATRLQAAGLLILESLLLALPGAGIGAALGRELAAFVCRSASQLAGVELRIAQADTSGALWAAGLGTVVALASAAIPALKAAQTSPLAAVRSRCAEAATNDGRSALLWSWAALALGAGGALLCSPPSTSKPAVTYALVLLLLAGTCGALRGAPSASPLWP
jgi:putative ABC transport system permease protein